MEALRFSYQDAKIYPVIMSIQIHARGPEFFLIKRCSMAHSECPQIHYYQSKSQQFPTIVKIICHISHQYQSRSAC